MSTWDERAFRGHVQAELDAFIDRQARALTPLGEDAARLIDQARLSVSGGKRLRAAFCWWGFHSWAPTPTPEQQTALVRACAALEILHASALVHDDFMDDSDTRRGAPATHRHFELLHAELGWSGPSSSYGAAGAILLGDLLLAWADEMLRRSGFGWDVLGPALEIFDACRAEVIAGQFLDVSVQARGAADVETAMTVLRYKSAKYSVERPLHIGAALAGAGAEHLDHLSGFGISIGEAFQLRDDILGVFGDPSVTGKPAGDDLIEGKRTVLVAQTLAAASEAAAEFVDAALGKALTADDVDRVRAIIVDSGALAAVEAQISTLTEAGLAALETPVIAERSRAALADLARAATQRTI